MERRIQWKQVLLWHMLVHVPAGVFAPAIIASASELQTEIRLQQTLKIQPRKFRIRELYYCSLRNELFQLSKALLSPVKPYCTITQGELYDYIKT